MSPVNHLALLSGNSVKNLLVLAHRGASAYRPENTLAAFELGVSQLADGMEFDLVATKDQHLVIRHENHLAQTTDVSSKPEFESRMHRDIDVKDWFSEEFTLPELKTLRAVERLPEDRSGSALFDGQFEIPTFAELLHSDFIRDQILVVELKSGTHLEVLDESIGTIAVREILNSTGIKRGVTFVFESFDFEILLDAKRQAEAAGLQAKFFYLLEDTNISEIDLDTVAKDFDGISISLEMLFAEPNWVENAHSVGLDIWTYTARAEEAETTVEEYYERIIQTGVDGIFADHPDLLRRVLDDRG
ncbi:MAG: hypothetical protein EB055_04225 [Micrococcales bacterium]|nr:hypothetical protein [Micrococcales bacterium]